MLRTELEILTGKVFQGSIMPGLFELFQGTAYRKELLHYLQGGYINAEVKISTDSAVKDVNHRITLKEWLSDKGKPVSL
jgi:hypothetical protein